MLITKSNNIFVEVNFDINTNLYKPILSAKLNEFPVNEMDASMLENIELDIMDKNGQFFFLNNYFKKDLIKIKNISFCH